MNTRVPGRAPIEDEVGMLLAARLNESLPSLGADIGERLRFARERAVARARVARTQAFAAAPAWQGAASLGLAGAGGTWSAGLMMPGRSAPGSGGSWWAKLVSALPLVILALGFVAIQDTLLERQIQAAAEVDAALLADDLPPQAYSDPGFAEFLRRQER